MSSEKKKLNKKIKNLISVIILLAGVVLGSLFVDVAQLTKGSGFSSRKLSKSDIFEADNKTWVAYSEPAVGVVIVNDEQCEKCDVSEALVWLKRVLPTVSTENIAFDSNEGKKLIDTFSIKTLPAFVFDSNIEKTEFYTQAKVLFTEKNKSFVLNTQELGLPAGKYLELPKIAEGDAISGDQDSKVKVFIFSDFQCPYCKMFYQSLRTVMKDYSDKAFFDYKHLPLDIHPQAEGAALASLCAQEQNKFWEYSDRLYEKQSEWGNAKDANKFKEYARLLGLNAENFNQCLDSKKYQEKLNADKKEAQDYGVSGTPAIFVNDQFANGALNEEQMKKMIDDELSK